MMKNYYTINELATISGPEDFVLDTINGWYK